MTPFMHVMLELSSFLALTITPYFHLPSRPPALPLSFDPSIPPSLLPIQRTSSCVMYFSNSSLIKFPTMENVMRPRNTRPVTQERWD